MSTYTIRGARLLAALLLATLPACSDDSSPLAPLDPARQDSYWTPGAGQEPLKVLTLNTYLGGDTGPLFNGLDLSNLPAVLMATNTFWAQVRANRTPERARAIVREIEARRPHFVGLQEVVRFAVVDLGSGTVVDGADILASIQAELAARGLDYVVERVQVTTSSQLPLAVAGGQLSRVLSFTDRVAVLRRADVPVTSSASGRYAAAFQLGPFSLGRGWVRVSTVMDGAAVHFVTTHLETQGLAPLQAAQLQELLGVLDALQGLTILTGDLNSDAEAGPGVPSWTPTYGTLIGAGFTDAWEQSGQGRDPGYTCCQAVDLRNASPTLDERLDFVLLRTTDDAPTWRIPGSVRVELVGDDPDERTDGGLWVADHAGLAAGLHLPLTFPGRG